MTFQANMTGMNVHRMSVDERNLVTKAKDSSERVMEQNLITSEILSSHLKVDFICFPNINAQKMGFYLDGDQFT